jgi:hypothetical protein
MQKLFKIFLKDADWTKIHLVLGPGSDVGNRIRFQDAMMGPKKGKIKNFMF